MQNSRDGDPNSMLRLAKMYLHGQGCQRSIGMAQQWLGRA
jgi:TPR repeat protein